MTVFMTDQQVVGLLQQALKRMDATDLRGAEALLTQVLDARKDEPDALQLLGLVRRTEGRNAEAEDFYRRSLAAQARAAPCAAQSRQSADRAGRSDEAIEALTEAARQKPDYVDAHVNLGKALLAAGKAAAAGRGSAPGPVAERRQPDGDAVAGRRAERSGTAEGSRSHLPPRARGASAQSPPDRRPGTQSRRLGQHAAPLRGSAAACSKRPRAKVPEMPTGRLQSRQYACSVLGRLDEGAVDAYRRAIARQPLDMAAHRDLNDMLYRLGRDDEFLQSYDEVALLYPDRGEILSREGPFPVPPGGVPSGATRELRARRASSSPANVTPHDGLALGARANWASSPKPSRSTRSRSRWSRRMRMPGGISPKP